jgi:hypothetical protein
MAFQDRKRCIYWRKRVKYDNMTTVTHWICMKVASLILWISIKTTTWLVVMVVITQLQITYWFPHYLFRYNWYLYIDRLDFWFLTVEHIKEYLKTSRQIMEIKLTVDMIHMPRVYKKNLKHISQECFMIYGEIELEQAYNSSRFRCYHYSFRLC